MDPVVVLNMQLSMLGRMGRSCPNMMTIDAPLHHPHPFCLHRQKISVNRNSHPAKFLMWVSNIREEDQGDGRGPTPKCTTGPKTLSILFVPRCITMCPGWHPAMGF